MSPVDDPNGQPETDSDSDDEVEAAPSGLGRPAATPPLGAEDRGLGIALTSKKTDWKEAALFFWNIKENDKDTLADLVAHLMLSNYVTVKSRASGRTPTGDSTAITTLRNVNSIIQKRIHINSDHRDGLLFQHIMWITSAWDNDPLSLIRAPHTRHIDHGQDGFIVHLKSDGSVEAATICEDKAVNDAADAFRVKVIPEITEYEQGLRDDELKTETVNLLQSRLTPEQAQSAANLFWTDTATRRYRVRLSYTPDTPGRRGPRRKYLSGFMGCVADPARRRGDIVIIESLRDWMNDFANRVESALLRIAQGRP